MRRAYRLVADDYRTVSSTASHFGTVGRKPAYLLALDKSFICHRNLPANRIPCPPKPANNSSASRCSFCLPPLHRYPYRRREDSKESCLSSAQSRAFCGVIPQFVGQVEITSTSAEALAFNLILESFFDGLLCALDVLDIIDRHTLSRYAAPSTLESSSQTLTG